MSRQLFPVLESTGGGGGTGKDTKGIGTFGSFSLNLAINFGIINTTLDYSPIKSTNILFSDLSLPNKGDGAKSKSYIGATELT